MTRTDAIRKISNLFANRDESDWVALWLTSFFDTEGFQKTLMAHARIHNDFNYNPAYLKYKAFLQPLCAHAIQSYSEGLELTLQEPTREVGAAAMFQVLEPVVWLGRVSGAKDVRVVLMEMVSAGGAQ